MAQATTIEDIKQQAQHKMDASITALKTTLSHIRTGRANPWFMGALLVAMAPLLVAFTVLLERKVLADMQSRLGGIFR